MLLPMTNFKSSCANPVTLSLHPFRNKVLVPGEKGLHTTRSSSLDRQTSERARGLPEVTQRRSTYSDRP